MLRGTITLPVPHKDAAAVGTHSTLSQCFSWWNPLIQKIATRMSTPSCWKCSDLCSPYPLPASVSSNSEGETEWTHECARISVQPSAPASDVRDMHSGSSNGRSYVQSARSTTSHGPTSVTGCPQTSGLAAILPAVLQTTALLDLCGYKRL